MHKLFGLLSLLVIASMVLSACGAAAPSAAPMPSNIVISGDEVEPRLTALEDLSQLKYRSYRLIPWGNDEYCFKGCFGGKRSDYMLVRRWGDQYQIIREVVAVNDEHAIPEMMLEAERIQLQMLGYDPALTYLELGGNGHVRHVMPAFKDYISVEQYIYQYGTKERVLALKDLLIEHRLELYRRGVADLFDPGVYNDLVNPYTGQVMSVDFQYVRLADMSSGRPAFPSRYPRLASEDAYAEFIRGIYEEQVRAFIAKLPPRLNAVQTREARVVRSSVDGTVHELTLQEMRILKAGGDPTIRMLESKGLKFSPLSTGERAFAYTMGVFEVATDVYMTYTLLDTVFDMQDLGATVELDVSPTVIPLFAEEPTDPLIIQRAEDLATKGLLMSPAFYLYFDRDLDGVLQLMENRFNQPYFPRLDNPQFSEIPGVLEGHDAYPPIIVSSPKENTLMWTNYETGEYIAYVKGSSGWQLTSASACIAADTFVSTIDDQGLVEYKIPFDLCIYQTGAAYTPAWTYR